MRWPWKRRQKRMRPPSQEAQHALARAIEDKREAEAKWLPVADVVARLDYHVRVNGFGEDLRAAMRKRRG